MQNLIHHAVPSGTGLIGPKFIFQHDNDPKHTQNLDRYYGRKEQQGVMWD